MIVFVHGNPQTAGVWTKVRAAVPRESVALSLPGFGCARPPGFGATMNDYADWLDGELDRIDDPIDLVGHDWGGLLTYRMAATRGRRLRSWVADVAHLAHPDYEWHDFAKIWQTPGEGEAFVAGQAATPPEDRAAFFELMGVPFADGLELAKSSDVTMGTCILDLYRSAVPNPHHVWGPWTPTDVPGLVLHAADDALADEALAREVAGSLGARFVQLDRAGHFWPYQAPEAGAALLESFWTSLG